jgi:hypothetical protein
MLGAVRHPLIARSRLNRVKPTMLRQARFATNSEKRVCAWLSNKNAYPCVSVPRNTDCLACERATPFDGASACAPVRSTSDWELQQLGLFPDEMAPTEFWVPARSILYTVWNFIQLPELPSLARAGLLKFQLLELLLSCLSGNEQYSVQLEDICQSMLSHARCSLQKVP